MGALKRPPSVDVVSRWHENAQSAARRGSAAIAAFAASRHGRANAEAAELQRKLEISEHETQQANWKRAEERASLGAEVKVLKKEVKKEAEVSLAGRKVSVDKIKPQSTHFYKHVDVLYKNFKRFQNEDVADRARLSRYTAVFGRSSRP